MCLARIVPAWEAFEQRNNLQTKNRLKYIQSLPQKVIVRYVQANVVKRGSCVKVSEKTSNGGGQSLKATLGKAIQQRGAI